MDVVRSLNEANTILPAGDVKIGPRDFNIYTNAQLPTTQAIDNLPLRTVGNGQLLVSDVGYAKDSNALQTTIVRVDGQKSVYLPILKQGGGLQHHCCRERHSRRHPPPRRHAQIACDQSRLRSIDLRQDGDPESRQRGRHRPGPYRRHDPDLSRQLPCHARGHALDSTLPRSRRF